MNNSLEEKTNVTNRNIIVKGVLVHVKSIFCGHTTLEKALF